MDPFNMLQVSILGIFRGVCVCITRVWTHSRFQIIPEQSGRKKMGFTNKEDETIDWKKDLQKVYEKQKGIDILNQCFFEATSVFFCSQKVMVFQQLQAAAVAPLVVPAAAARYSLVGWALGAPGAKWVRGDPGVTQVGNGISMGFIVI